MEILQENVEFQITSTKFDSSTERLTIKMQPLNNTRYLDEMHISFHYKHDYPDYKYYRRFITNNNISSTDISNLIGKKIRGSIAHFIRKDGTEFDGPYSSSLRLIEAVSLPLLKVTEIAKNKSIENKIEILIRNKKSLKEMAAEVLNTAGPLHAKHIWNEIAKRGYISCGKTPDLTVSSHLYMDIKKNGEKSIFIKTGPNTFDLKKKSIISDQYPVKEKSNILMCENVPVFMTKTTATPFIRKFIVNVKNTIYNFMGKI